MGKKNNGGVATLISPTMKLADLVELNHNLLAVLSRLGVSLGFGEHTIDEACRLHGVSTDAFLLICNVYNFGGYVPSEGALDRADVRDIMKYLHNSHVDYTSTTLKELEESLTVMMEPCSEAQKKMIGKFFKGYRDEVISHFEYEEKTVLPYVGSVLDGRAKGGYSIEQFEENHSNIEEKLCDLKNIVMKYLPETCDQALRYEVLHQIYHLEKDLTKHTLIEDNVLIPMVARMEA